MQFIYHMYMVDLCSVVVIRVLSWIGSLLVHLFMSLEVPIGPQFVLDVLPCPCCFWGPWVASSSALSGLVFCILPLHLFSVLFEYSLHARSLRPRVVFCLGHPHQKQTMCSELMPNGAWLSFVSHALAMMLEIFMLSRQGVLPVLS